MQFDIRITGSKAVVVESDNGDYHSIKDVKSYFKERAKTQGFDKIYLDSANGAEISDINELKNEAHYQKLVKEHKQKATEKKPFYKSGWLFFLVNFLLIAWVFYGGYQYLEPIGWHSWMEGHFPNIFNAWNHHPNAKAYEITYAWLFLIGVVMLPYFIYLVNSGDNPVLVEEVLVDKQRWRAFILFLFLQVWLFWSMLFSPFSGKMSYLLYHTEVVGLFSQLYIILGCYGAWVLFISCIFCQFGLLIGRGSKHAV